MRKIWHFLVFIIIILLILVAIFSYGVSIKNIEIAEFKIDQLYIKLDKKLILKAQNIQIPAKNSNINGSDEDLLRLTKNLAWIDRLFAEISLKNIKIGEDGFDLHFTKNLFHINSPYLNIDTDIISINSGVLANINKLEFKDFNITMSGVANVNVKKGIYDFNGTLSSFELNGNAKLRLEKDQLKYELSDVNATSLELFINELGRKFGLNEEVKKWIYGIKADNYYLKILQGKADIAKQNFYLNELYANATSNNLKVKFHQNLAPADVEQANIELIGGTLRFDLIQPKWQGRDLNGSNLKIYKIFEEGAGLALNLKINSPYDKVVGSILKAYDLDIAVEQLSGKTNGILGLDLKFDPFVITARGEFIMRGGHTLIAGADFGVGEAQVSLNDTKLTIKAKKSGMDFFTGDFVASLDLSKQKGDINGTANDFNLKFGDKEILAFKNMPLNATLDFADKTTIMQIFNPDVRLSFGEKNEIKIKDISPLVKDSVLLSGLGISGADFTLQTRNFKDFLILANDVKFDAPLYNKNGEKYTLDSFEININGDHVRGKNSSDKIKFSAKDGKINLDINGLDLQISSNDNVTDTVNFEIDAINSNLLLSDLNSTIKLTNYHAKTINDELSFDAKAGLENLHLFKSDSKFKISANEISGEFINSIFNIKSFSGGSFKMEILGESTQNFKGEMRLIDATLKDFTFYHQLLTFLNSVPSLLIFKTPDFDTSGYPVKFGKILFERKGDELNIVAAELESSSADIAGHGNINLKTKEINIELELKLLKDASSIIDKIPLVNQIILGKDRTLSTIIKISGTLQEPEYSTQILSDTLLSPLKIIRNILQAPFLIFE